MSTFFYTNVHMYIYINILHVTIDINLNDSQVISFYYIRKIYHLRSTLIYMSAAYNSIILLLLFIKIGFNVFTFYTLDAATIGNKPTMHFQV